MNIYIYITCIIHIIFYSIYIIHITCIIYRGVHM